MTNRADVSTMLPEDISNALDEGRLDGILSGVSAGGDGADQGARGQRMRGSYSEHLRAELQTLSPGEIDARLGRGDYDGLLRGER